MSNIFEASKIGFSLHEDGKYWLKFKIIDPGARPLPERRYQIEPGTKEAEIISDYIGGDSFSTIIESDYEILVRKVGSDYEIAYDEMNKHT